MFAVSSQGCQVPAYMYKSVSTVWVGILWAQVLPLSASPSLQSVSFLCPTKMLGSPTILPILGSVTKGSWRCQWKSFPFAVQLKTQRLGSICKTDQKRQNVTFFFFMGMEVLKASKLCWGQVRHSPQHVHKWLHHCPHVYALSVATRYFAEGFGSVRMKQTLFNLLFFLRPSGLSKHSRHLTGQSWTLALTGSYVR